LPPIAAGPSGLNVRIDKAERSWPTTKPIARIERSGNSAATNSRLGNGSPVWRIEGLQAQPHSRQSTTDAPRKPVAAALRRTLESEDIRSRKFVSEDPHDYVQRDVKMTFKPLSLNNSRRATAEAETLQGASTASEARVGRAQRQILNWQFILAALLFFLIR